MNLEMSITTTKYKNKSLGEMIILFYEQSLLFGEALKFSLGPTNQIMEEVNTVDN